jgi:hypothetical protein
MRPSCMPPAVTLSVMAALITGGWGPDARL